jgi:hypothetical protein
MNKKRILFGTGAAVLAIAAFLAVKANNKFNTVIGNLYYTTGGASHTCVLIGSSVFQTVGAPAVAMTFITATGGTANLFSGRNNMTNACQNPIPYTSTNKIRLVD